MATSTGCRALGGRRGVDETVELTGDGIAGTLDVVA
jgi:hypothetical protein